MLALYLTYLDDANDKRLFEDIYYAYRKQMVSLALSILKQKEDAEDAVGSVFLRIVERHWQTVCDIKTDADLRNYLLKATKNTCLNMLRDHKRVTASIDTVSEFDLSGIQTVSDDEFVEAICTRIEAEQITNAIEKLGEKYRNVLYYHFVLELSMAETAQLLDQTVPTTQKQLVRGKKMLLKMLGVKGI